MNSPNYESFTHRKKSVVKSGPPELVRLANVDPLPNLSSDQVQQIETEIMNLTKSLSSCSDDGMRTVFLCRRGAMLRKVCVCVCVCVCKYHNSVCVYVAKVFTL